MTVGGDECEDEAEVSDLRESLRAWSTLAGPSSSSAAVVDQQLYDLSSDCDPEFEAVLSSVFANENRLFQPLSDDTFSPIFTVQK
ncbi:unnamed protein product [Gongylonema pulchrum]|uniref:Uncharacterized protein n=1 Tax=Gongylonema pulchrum TaxID=637853 RepID=A0A183DJN0_9BILA|nr:unnamed protein product [Gongylonema pulchrum]